MNQARQSRSPERAPGALPAGPANRPCRMPLTPAMRPLATSSHTLARPIRTPPITAGRGVKFSIVMVFRQLFDPQSSTYTYLLADAASREAVLIDPVFELARRDVALVEELGLRLSWTLETHLHADHVTGAWLLKQRLGSRIAVSRASGAQGADRYLEPGEEIRFGGRCLEARPTPGHTGGCVSYVLDDRSMAFSGRSEEHTELQSPCNLVCRLLLEKKKKNVTNHRY